MTCNDEVAAATANDCSAAPEVRRVKTVGAQICIRLDQALADEISAYRDKLAEGDLELSVAAAIRRLIKRGLRAERAK